MKLELIRKKTLFRKLFFIIFLAVMTPMVITGVHLFRFGLISMESGGDELLWIFSILLVLTFVFAVLGGFYLSKKLSKPITHFAKSATEIARGNFTHRIHVNSNDEIGRLARIFNYMTTELQRLNEMNLNKIISEKNKTETIIKNIADGVIVTDPENKILVLNSVAEKYFGVNEREVLERPLEDFIRNEELISLITKVRFSENNHASPIEIKLKPPRMTKEIVLQAKAARVVREKNELIGIVTILRDITREKEIDRMKTELVSMVAHELRSPLTSISGFSELLLDSGVSEEQSKEYAEIILKESNRLGDLINKFLDISKIEAGKSQINKVPSNLIEIIEKVVDTNLQQAERKGIQIKLNIPEDLAVILVDRDMIEEVVLNLFSNAIKYSPENTTVEIKVSENDSVVRLEVIDEGYGISAKSLPRIFEKFYRVTDNENVRDISGSGLGLSLVKEIVEIHGGSVSVTSTLGKGSTFTVTLPKMNGLPQEFLTPELEEVGILES